MIDKSFTVNFVKTQPKFPIFIVIAYRSISVSGCRTGT